MTRKGALHYLEPIDTQTRGVAILDALADMIDRAEIEIGDRLPSEILLADRLGVGRSTIREALNRWEGVGIIRRRRGSGTFLTARVQSSSDLVPTMIKLEGEALLRLIEVRRALENDVVRKAALNATDNQRAEISKLYKKLMATVEAREPWRKVDEAFHGAIYDASGNPVFGQILRRIDEALERSPESPFGAVDFALDSFPMHAGLHEGVVSAKPEMAVEAISAILDIVESEIKRIVRYDKT
jgi:GntR family transcriptional repressor for pyruvate dehydrogenase complex